jgi:hypothetical protein
MIALWEAVPIKLGIAALNAITRVSRAFSAQAATALSVSISFSHRIIWFQVGMLWDANILKLLAVKIISSLRGRGICSDHQPRHRD